MQLIVDGHGIYRNRDNNVFVCMATRQARFEAEGGDLHGADPIAFIAYRKIKGVNDTRSVELVTRHAREIIAHGNQHKLDDKALGNVIQRRRAEIRKALTKAQRNRAKAGSANARSSVRPSRRMGRIAV